MAEVAVSTVVTKLTELLLEQTTSTISHISTVRDQVESLKNQLSWMQCFLKDADAKQQSNERVRMWVSDIRNVTFEAEEIIETHIYNSTIQTHFHNKIFTPFHLYKLGSRIERICKKIKEVSDRREMYGVVIKNPGSNSNPDDRDGSSSNERLRHWRQPSPYYAEEEYVVEVKEDFGSIFTQLVSLDSTRHVVSLVGMGGLGKTTLAKKLYNDSRIANHFEIKAWVYVSEEYRRKDVLQGILRGVDGVAREDMDRMPEEELVNKLHNALAEKRYLVVLDDIWGMEVWDGLKYAFPRRKLGSKILLTTRILEVALHADGNSDPYQLRPLNHDESYALLRSKAFPGASVIPSEFENLAKEIVVKCEGLPLAVVVVGGLLSRKLKSSGEWARELQNIRGGLLEDQEKITRILALSYNDLPPPLKSCFLYLGLFPKGMNIQTKKLIRLWVAEGFLPQEGGETAEDVAQRYLNELIGRCMIQVGTVSSMGRVKTIRIHDLLRELSVTKGKEEYFGDMAGSSSTSQLTKSRRHSLHSCHERYDFLKHIADYSRSLLFFNREYNADIDKKVWIHLSFMQEKKLNFIYTEFKLLRVLELDGVRLVSLPSTIGDLIQLRYLGLRKTNLEGKLPLSIRNLLNLQTLDLRYCCFLKKIPNVIWKLVNLRHLLLYTPFDSPDSGHLRLDTLTNLQSLPYIEAGNWISDGGLANMTNLRQLGINGLSGQMVNSVLSTIQGLRNLHSLSLSLQSEEDEFPIFMQLSQCTQLQKLSLNGKIKKLPDPHEFPPNLLKLTLHNSHLQKESIAKLERLPKLKMLVLGKKAYNWAELSFSAEGFSQLHVLRLTLLKELEEWKVEEKAMPMLEYMVIDRCEKLRKIPEGLKDITSLKKLKITGMPVDFEHRLRTKDLLEFKNIPIIESTTDILSIVLLGDRNLHLRKGSIFKSGIPLYSL
ncbi:NB-ARC domain disease resistance protein [Medicago truncatula]|uniref:NB-ARC domain disease resistance protein n=1 Tax=Medicago truncatula TaxID=3880 RepID=G7KF19_MEDTR|nr:NB-ARC domain disease resistance protein [Medicago truncatula]